MAIERKDKEPKEGNSVLESSSRRKAVKTIVGGVTAFAAYNALPSKWGTPIIEQVFLPAHAATSCQGAVIGPCTVTHRGFNTVPGGSNWELTLSGFVTPPIEGLQIRFIRSYHEVDGDVFTMDSGTVGYFLLTDSNGNYSWDDEKDTTQMERMEYTVSIEGCPGSSTCSLVMPTPPPDGE